MITRVVMPKLTDTMEEGVLVTWKKEENDVVAAGDILAEIETDKAVMDLEAFGSGFLRKKLAGEGETVKAGALIAVVAELDDDIEPVLSEVSHDGGGSSVPVTRPPAPVKEFSPPPSGKEKLPNTATEPPQQTVSVKASPRAKAKAKEFGIDLSNIKGSGPRGRIVEEDISELIKGDTILEAQTTDRPLSQIRKAIARITTESKAPVPHFYLTAEVSMAEAEQLRTQAKLTQKTSLSMTPLFVKSVALALSRHPDINASFHGDSIRQHGRIDIGVAVALEDGLVTPVIRDCVRKDIFELSKEIQILIDRSRQKQLLPEEYTGATFSISNLGMYQVENFIAVLVPPQAASLAIGAIQSVPVADGELIKIDRRMKITLSCDHRALDGAQGAKFLQTFKYILEHPLQLFLSTTS
jgi:pyruvate dehydrogenase E2 component (dihydrolipoamide acetyltransferase)